MQRFSCKFHDLHFRESFLRKPLAMLKKFLIIMGRGVVGLAGLEPARPYGQQILSLQRLPIPPQAHLLLGLFIEH